MGPQMAPLTDLQKEHLMVSHSASQWVQQLGCLLVPRSADLKDLQMAAQRVQQTAGQMVPHSES